MTKFLLGSLVFLLCATTTYAHNENHYASQNHEDADYLYSWCADATRKLREGLRRGYTLVQQDKLTEARSVLTATLRDAGKLNTTKYQVQPMTKRLIDRGLKYLTVTNQLKWSAPERFKLISQLNFLSKYIELIIDTELNLDRRYHIPYHYGCQYGCGFSIEAYEAAFVQQMRKELDYVVNSFTTIGSNSRYVPVGSAEILLKVSETLAAGVAKDLSENLFAYQNACSVMDLKHTARILNRFNWSKDRSYYTSQADAVHFSSVSLSEIADNLYPGRRYYSRPSHIYNGYTCMD